MSSALLFFALLFAGPSLAEPPSAPAVEPAPQSAQADQSPSESGGEEQILTEIAHQLQTLQEESTAIRKELADQRVALENLREQVIERNETEEPSQGMPSASTTSGSTAGGRVVVPPGASTEEATALFDNAVIFGHVSGNATAIAGDVIIESTGVVDGDAVSLGGRVLVKSGGVVHGNQVELGRTANFSNATMSQGVSWFSGLYNRLIFLLTFAGSGVLIIGLFPDRVGRVANAIEKRPFRLTLTGALWTGLLTALATLFALICIGLPLSVVILAFLGIAWMLGFIATCQVVGDRLPAQKKEHGRWLTFLLGTLLIGAVSLLPWVGWLALAGTGMMGIGAALHTHFGSR